MPRRLASLPIEKYELARSPFSNRPTQRDIGKLLGISRDRLRFLVNNKEDFIKRREAIIGKKQKVRELKYPVKDLRKVHEKIKFHLNKIKQPSYLFSPRKKRGQRDNAALHLEQQQYLTLDIKQFYPSTTIGMVRRWFRDELGMYPDVAGLLSQLCTVDDQVSFGSPLTPVLCSLIHRPMFHRIADLCEHHDLRYSLWVDDVTISGQFVSGDVIREIRQIIASAGLKSHQLRSRTGNRPVYITGIGVVGRHLVAPNAFNLQIRRLWQSYADAETVWERDACIQALLAQLGTQRYICGRSSNLGRKASDQMNSLRQKRDRMHIEEEARLQADRAIRLRSNIQLPGEAPF